MGIEATRQIRQRHALAYAISEVKKDAMAAGCTEVFEKPLDFELLMGKIRDTVRVVPETEAGELGP